jgi:hypothetical protein
MTLDETLLPRLAEWRPAGAGPHSFGAPLAAPGWALAVTADRAESLGCLATELTVWRQPDDRPVEAAALTQWAVRTARRVTSLLEPLKLVEVDVTRSEALLRSERPVARGDAVQYYELLLRGEHTATLRRYQAPRTGPGKRRAVPFALTHEAIAKLAADLTAAE